MAKPSDTRQRRALLQKDGMVATILFVALGATIGASLRYAVALWAAAHLGATFPYGTLLVNVIGSFILGLFLTIVTERLAISTEWRLVIATGFCGSLTTFSTFSYETVQLLTEGSYLAGALNIGANVVLSIVGVLGGVALARTVAGVRCGAGTPEAPRGRPSAFIL